MEEGTSPAELVRFKQLEKLSITGLPSCLLARGSFSLDPVLFRILLIGLYLVLAGISPQPRTLPPLPVQCREHVIQLCIEGLRMNRHKKSFAAVAFPPSPCRRCIIRPQECPPRTGFCGRASEGLNNIGIRTRRIPSSCILIPRYSWLLKGPIAHRLAKHMLLKCGHQKQAPAAFAGIGAVMAPGLLPDWRGSQQGALRKPTCPQHPLGSSNGSCSSSSVAADWESRGGGLLQGCPHPLHQNAYPWWP